MAYQMTERDKRTIVIGVIAAIAILAYVFLDDWLADWKNIRSQLKTERQKLSEIMPSADGSLNSKQAGLLQTVPVMEMPRKSTVQKGLFKDKFNEQLKRAGINVQTLHDMPITKSKGSSGFTKLQLQCSGKCSTNQVMDLLANLYENPYFVGVENLVLTCDQKNRSQMDFKLTVSTFIK